MLSEVEAKSQNADTEPAKMMPHDSKAAHPGVCDDACSKLLLELRQTIHEYLGTMQEEVYVRRTLQAGEARAIVTTTYANRVGTVHFCPPWYFDYTTLGDTVRNKQALNKYLLCLLALHKQSKQSKTSLKRVK
jgi:hypothetical protein